jgi:hypothetical protein
MSGEQKGQIRERGKGFSTASTKIDYALWANVIPVVPPQQ